MRTCSAVKCPHYRHLRTRSWNLAPSNRPPASTRFYAVAAPNDIGKKEHDAQSLAAPSLARFNDLGVQQVSDHVHSQLFASKHKRPPQEYIDLSKKHLSHHDLLGKNQDNTSPVAFDLPALQGKTLDEHFHTIGLEASEPYLSLAQKLATANCPPRPRKWVKRSGWTKYHADGTSEPVGAPNESAITFDTEVMWKETSFPAMACAVSATNWYSWLSPWLLGESKSDRHLIPIGDPQKPRIVVGHNIGYDRARTFEEYDLKQSENYFVDTMSLHVAVNGMCTRQRPTWMKQNKARELRDEIANSAQGADLHALLNSKSMDEEEEHLWIGRSSVNSLRDVAKFHCGVTIDKARREDFGELNKHEIVAKYDELLDYCAADVDITHRVYRKILPAFLETCPHPVSFAALRHLSSVILPVNETWEQYIEDAEDTYHRALDDVRQRLVHLTDKALKVKDKPEIYQNDPWLRQLDWSGQEIRMTKPKKKGEEPRPVKRQKMPGMPMWYKDLFPVKDEPINLTVRTRIAPLMLRLAWDGHPLIWSDKHGWVFKVPVAESRKYEAKAVVECDMIEEKISTLRDDLHHKYFKLPHKDGPAARCASPLAKGYLQHFEKGTLHSEYPLAKEALEMNASCSYWISSRERISSQLVVYDSDISSRGPTERRGKSPSHKQGYILPQIIPMGTITRRAVENTWLTASNAKRNRVGSELKSMIKAPPGHVFVGADVDSQELWIASLMGDAQFKQHGGSAIGFMTLEGSKAAGTDLHSRTAGILGISRNDAKVFNYGRIYGAGLNFASTLLKQFNPDLTSEEAGSVAQRLYAQTKGTRTLRRALSKRSFWRGGTESLVFNTLEEFAEQDKPRTPALGAGITEALMRRFISKGEFMTSRVNWAIQSSGVDYLHLLIVSMSHLCAKYKIKARLAITVHDEIRYLVAEDDKYRAALALQISNVWTRAMFAEQIGIHDLPESCAWFSAVDVDHVLRKEVDMDCVTPSHKTAIPPGESLDVMTLLAKGDGARLALGKRDAAQISQDAERARQLHERHPYKPREPVMATLQSETNMDYLRAQLATSEDDLRQIAKDQRKRENQRMATAITSSEKKSQPAREKTGSVGTGRGKGRKLKPMITPEKWRPQGVTLPEVPWSEMQRLESRKYIPKWSATLGHGKGPPGSRGQWGAIGH